MHVCLSIMFCVLGVRGMDRSIPSVIRNTRTDLTMPLHIFCLFLLTCACHDLCKINYAQGHRDHKEPQALLVHRGLLVRRGRMEHRGLLGWMERMERMVHRGLLGWMERMGRMEHRGLLGWMEPQDHPVLQVLQVILIFCESKFALH